jgi:hypothetical protein
LSSAKQPKNTAAIQRLREEIVRLTEQQAAAEQMAVLNGMTIDDSRQYKERHDTIRRLTKELAALNDKR